MSSELLMAKGKLADLERQMQDNEMRAEAMLIQIRELLNPYSEFLDLDLNKVLLLVKDFREMQLKAREAQVTIDKIKSSFNL